MQKALRASNNKTFKQQNELPTVLFVLLLIIVPLYFENNYFNITPAKLHIYSVLAIPTLAIVLFCFFRNIQCHTPVAKLQVWEWCLLLFAAFTLISSLLCGNTLLSFWGTAGWCVGSFVIITASLLCILFSRTLNYRHNLWLPVIIVFDVIAIIGILQFAGLDVFSMHSGVSKGTYFYYITTIGNVNRYSGYLSLIFPLLFVFYLFTNDKTSNIIYLISLSICLFSIAICASDSIYLALGVMMFFALPCICKDAERLSKSCVIFAVFGICLALVTLLPCFEELRISASGISAKTYDLGIALSVVLFGAIGYIIFNFVGFRFPQKTYYIILIAAELILAAFAVVYFVKTAAEFGDEWGSWRGFIWRKSIEVFKGFSYVEKIFGTGPEMLGSVYTDITNAFGLRTLTAHSEPLQILLSTGIIGFALYAATCISIVVKALREHILTTEKAAFFLPLAAYFAQSLVSSDTVINVTVLCAIASCFSFFTNKSISNGGNK